MMLLRNFRLAQSICRQISCLQATRNKLSETLTSSHSKWLLSCKPEYSEYKQIHTMGSTLCKEYKTTGKITPNPEQNSAAPTGSYQSKSDKMSPKSPDSDYTDPVAVCQVNDLEENTMKQVEFDEETSVLLVKQNGRLHALGAKCTHYGAPMHTGALGVGRIRCPWHGACFNLETGDIEDFPGLDSLPCYKVNVSDAGEILVSIKRTEREKSTRLKSMAKRNPQDERCFIVVGGGPSGAICAETLRQEGFTGRLIMVCREPYPPYDRVKVSKAMSVPIEKLQLRDPKFYEDNEIELWLNVSATKLATVQKELHCSNGYVVKYDKIYIATGCSAYKPPIPGAQLENVKTIRDYDDAQAILKLITPDMNVVCLGSSFVALEAAASLVSKVASVTVVGRENVPLKAAFGEQIGARVLQLYKDNKVNMIMESGITEILGDDKVTEVQLLDETLIPCNLLIMGTGSRMNTEFLKDSGVRLNANGSIDVTDFLETNVPDVYVGGDIANAHIYGLAQSRVNIGHYQLAQYHGRIAAINMAGSIKKSEAVPFFFTLLFGKGIRYAGHGSYKDVIIDGSLEDMKFVAYFVNHADTVTAVASCNRDPVVAQFAELIAQGKCLGRQQIENEEDRQAWTAKLVEPVSKVR